jgi:hypothetical protein
LDGVYNVDWEEKKILVASRKFATWNDELKWVTEWNYSISIDLIHFDCVIQQLRFELGKIDAWCERYTTVVVNIALYQKKKF